MILFADHYVQVQHKEIQTQEKFEPQQIHVKTIYRYTVNFTEIKGKFFGKRSSDRNIQGDHYIKGCYNIIQVWLYLADRTSHLFYNLASVTLTVCCQKFNKQSATFSLASSTFSTDDNCLLLFCSQHGLVCSISKSINVAEKSCGKDTLNVLKDVTNWVWWTLC